MQMMQILAFGYICVAVTQSLSGIMRGAGDTMTPMWISVLQTVVVRIPLAYAPCYLSRSPEFPGGRREYIYVSLLAAWVIGAAVSVLLYKRGKWKNIVLK